MKPSEIKYRAFDKNKKQMFNVTMILWETEEIDIEGNNNEPYHWDNFEPLMQFTGLTLFGDGLYEGDVITAGEFNYTVEFERGTFILKHTRKSLGNWGPVSRMFDADMKGLSFRKIGNIHENPELLTP